MLCADTLSRARACDCTSYEMSRLLLVVTELDSNLSDKLGRIMLIAVFWMLGLPVEVERGRPTSSTCLTSHFTAQLSANVSA